MSASFIECPCFCCVHFFFLSISCLSTIDGRRECVLSLLLPRSLITPSHCSSFSPSPQMFLLPVKHPCLFFLLFSSSLQDDLIHSQGPFLPFHRHLSLFQCSSSFWYYIHLFCLLWSCIFSSFSLLSTILLLLLSFIHSLFPLSPPRSLLESPHRFFPPSPLSSISLACERQNLSIVVVWNLSGFVKSQPCL